MASERFSCAIFIDGANLYHTAKALGFEIDYKRLLKYYNTDPEYGGLLRAFYYTALLDSEDGYNSIRPLLDWLDYNGYTMRVKDAKTFLDQETGRKKTKGNMDIEIAVDVMRMAQHVNRIILFSGDGDFTALVEAVKDMGVKVDVVSTISTKPSMIADELRRASDKFVDLVEIIQKISRIDEPKKGDNPFKRSA